MILTEYVEVLINNKNFNYYKDKNYDVKLNQRIIVSVKDLPIHSRTLIIVECDNCGKKKSMHNNDYSKIIRLKNLDKYYCTKCKNIRTKETNLKKYGVENVFQSDEIKDKIKKTNIKKYGYDIAIKNPDILSKMIETNRKKYGVDFPMQLSENIKKLKKTCLDKYGVDNPMKSDDIKEKFKNIILNKYGTKTVLESEDIKNKFIKTNKDKYGNSCPLLNDNIKHKSVNTLLNNYKVDNPMKCDEIKIKSLTTKIKNLLNKFKDIGIIKIENNIYTFKCDNGKNHEFELSSSLLYNRLKKNTILCTICNPINSYTNSGYEIQLQDFIKSNYNKEILFNKRIVMDKEVDIYLPDLRLAFEFNGIYYHNELHRSNDYHLNKTEIYEKEGIQLIHIYEDDWIYKKDIVKSMILNKLNKTPNKIYARKCKIKEFIDSELSSNFLKKNHIQGIVGSNIKIGLFYNNELVSLMTFGKKRLFLGNKNTDTDEYEMLRFCSKIYTNVVGGADRLFKYFLLKYKPNIITTYADRSWSNGNLYKRLNFSFVSKTKPNYYYVIDDKRYHRFGFRKDVLIKQGYDQNKTEHEIMLERNIYRIYDSGNLKFEWNSF